MTVRSSRHLLDQLVMIHCAQLPLLVWGAHRVYCAEVNLLEEGGEDCWKQWRQVRERLVLFLVKTKNRQKKCQHDDNSSMQMIGVKVFEDFDDLMREGPEVIRHRAKLLSISPTLWRLRSICRNMIEKKTRLGCRWPSKPWRLILSWGCWTLGDFYNICKNMCAKGILLMYRNVLDSSTIFKPLVTLTSGNTIMTYILVSVILTIS